MFPFCWCTYLKLHGVIANRLYARYGEDKKKPFSISKIQFISIKVVNSRLFGLYKNKKYFHSLHINMFLHNLYKRNNQTNIKKCWQAVAVVIISKSYLPYKAIYCTKFIKRLKWQINNKSPPIKKNYTDIYKYYNQK